MFSIVSAGLIRWFKIKLGIMPEKDLPDIARRGVSIDPVNPQPAVRENAEKAKDWAYADNARYLYDKAVQLRERLIDPIARIDRDRMPDPIISFGDLRNKNTLAAYRLVRNPQGLLYEITFNTEHYVDETKDAEQSKKVWKFGRWAELETLTHELVHEWQQTVGEDPIRLGKVYHNREFVDKCESIGLHPKLGEGYHLQLADGAFEVYMNEMGIPKPLGQEEIPPELDVDWFKWLEKFSGKDRKGKSTLSKWVCPSCDLKVRVGIKGDPELIHIPCGSVLIRGDSGTVYQSACRVDDTKLVKEAYRSMIAISGRTLDMADGERAERLNQMAQERLYRRLDKMVGTGTTYS